MNNEIKGRRKENFHQGSYQNKLIKSEIVMKNEREEWDDFGDCQEARTLPPTGGV